MDKKQNKIVIPNNMEISIYDYYKVAKKLLNNEHQLRFSKKNIKLKNELSFWSSYVNKDYTIVSLDSSTTEHDIRCLRREIELVAEFKLGDCTKQHMCLLNYYN